MREMEREERDSSKDGWMDVESERKKIARI